MTPETVVDAVYDKYRVRIAPTDPIVGATLLCDVVVSQGIETIRALLDETSLEMTRERMAFRETIEGQIDRLIASPDGDLPRRLAEAMADTLYEAEATAREQMAKTIDYKRQQIDDCLRQFGSEVQAGLSQFRKAQSVAFWTAGISTVMACLSILTAAWIAHGFVR